MSNLTILPADTYTVLNKTVINDSDLRIISMLYQPIIGFAAVSLYFTLVDDLDKLEIMSEELTHHHLMSTMQLKLEDIVIAREKLEAVGLLKTYVKKGSVNNFAYLLFSPISAYDFFNHPILNIVLYNNLGKKEYDKLINFYKIPRVVLKDYEEVTASFDEVFSSVRGNVLELNEDIEKKETNNIIISKGIDFNQLISSIPEASINDKCFNEETKELINALSFTYNLKTMDMQGLVMDSINEKGLIDKNKLRKSCRDYYQFENNGNLPTLIYNKQPSYLKSPDGDNSKRGRLVYAFENLTPYQFLKAKYKGAEPTNRDKRLIENLLVDQKFAPGVVNVLIAYVLKINNEQLKKSYVETIAGQWKRLNIQTVEEAMNITEKNHKANKKMITEDKGNKPNYVPKNKNSDTPAWFDKETKDDISDEEAMELDKILEDLV
ncbi:MAG: DnaD domain protein [Bacilli bacterium]|nr:DnaD domain protein [Bacilli bacterium]